jgi:molybdopterin converting factor small subunit
MFFSQQWQIASTLAASEQNWYICRVKERVMEVKVLFFGVLGDRAGCSEKSLLRSYRYRQLLKHRLRWIYPGLADFSYRISLNQSLITENMSLKNGDEVAYLPPFAGG